MRQRGFNLIELLMALGIAGILGLVVVPSFVGLLQRHALRSTAWDLFHTINSTRATAVSRNQTISLWNIDGHWHSGAEIFEDHNSNGQREADEPVLRHFGGRMSAHITGNHWVANYISYRPDGSAYTHTGAFQVGSITVCAEGQAEAYQLVISIGGRLRLSKTRDGCMAQN